MTKISVITVVYNGINLIEKTIKSVLDQSYLNIEYIIIDGNSNDGTKDILNKYVKFQNVKIYSEKDNGIYDAMNKGIQFSSGDWVLFLNAGDTFFTNDIIDNIFGGNKINFINFEFLYGDVNVIYSNFNRIIKAGDINNIWKGMQFSHQSVFIKNTYHKNKLYNIKYKVVADFNFIFNSYIENAKFLYLNKVISNTIIGGISDKNRFSTFLSTFNIILKKRKNIKIYMFFIFHFIYIFLTHVIKYFTPLFFINILIKRFK
jgi:glycosyltransferase involved in cell wall biosynthesis